MKEKRRFKNLLNLLIEKTSSNKHCLFFGYMPHVKKVYVEFYKNGWSNDSLPDMSEYIYFDDLFDLKTYKKINKFLKELA